MEERLQPRMWLQGQLLKDPQYHEGRASFDLVLVQPDGKELLVHICANEKLSRYLTKHQAQQTDKLLVVGTLDMDHVLSAEIICCDTSMDGDSD